MQVARQTLPFLNGAVGLGFSQCNAAVADIDDGTDLAKRLLMVINKITAVNDKSICSIGAAETVFICPVIEPCIAGSGNTLDYPFLVIG